MSAYVCLWIATIAYFSFGAYEAFVWWEQSRYARQTIPRKIGMVVILVLMGGFLEVCWLAGSFNAWFAVKFEEWVYRV